MKKIDPNSTEYRKLKIEMALDFCPPIWPCERCGHPVVSGYCCTNCGDSDPFHKTEPIDSVSTPPKH